MVALDNTIANVALPHMQSLMLAEPEQIVWVHVLHHRNRRHDPAQRVAGPALRSETHHPAFYSRFHPGIAGVLPFGDPGTACRLPDHPELGGAGLALLTQATLLDINPPERHGPAMPLVFLMRPAARQR